MRLLPPPVHLAWSRRARIRHRRKGDSSPAKCLKSEIAFAPDYLIIALGENVPDLPTQEDRLAYRRAFFPAGIGAAGGR